MCSRSTSSLFTQHSLVAVKELKFKQNVLNDTDVLHEHVKEMNKARRLELVDICSKNLNEIDSVCRAKQVQGPGRARSRSRSRQGLVQGERRLQPSPGSQHHLVTASSVVDKVNISLSDDWET